MRVEVRVRGWYGSGRGPEVIIEIRGGGGMVIFNVYVHNASHRTEEVMVPRPRG